MEQIRTIIQQKSKGLSIRSIAKQTGLSRNTVRTYLRLVESACSSLMQALELDDQALGELTQASNPVSKDERYVFLQSRLQHYASELKRKHVTRQLLWEEYRGEYPSGYGYTWFCHYLNEYIGAKEVTATFTHSPGEKLMVDFAGDKLGYIDHQSGEMVSCEVFVAVLPFSSYMYVEAHPSQKQEDFVKGLTGAFEYLGGVPQSVVCDNMKGVVKKANRYEPTFTELTQQLSLHYGTTLMATRVRKPRDKATAETSVNVAYNRIYGKLRNIESHSLEELNAQIREALEQLNRRQFKGRDHSRKDVFSRYESHHLNPMPNKAFEVKKSVFAKVQKNYHIILGENMHQYSVPFRYSGKKVKVVYTSSDVEVYLDHKRIAMHKRNYRRHGYSTLKEHMPDNHRAVMQQKGWDACYFLTEAAKTGENTHRAISQILSSRVFPEQTYNACLGVLRLAQKYGHTRLEAACKLMLNGPKASYGTLNNILKNNMDKLPEKQHEEFKTPEHDNIRGPGQYY